MTTYLRVKDILNIHKLIEEQYDIDSCILFPNNLEAAVESPKLTFSDTPIYLTIYDKAGALMRNLIKLHPFLDGNKRTGLLATILFLELNGRTLRRDINQEVETAKGTARCSLESKEITEWLSDNTRSTSA